MRTRQQHQQRAEEEFEGEEGCCVYALGKNVPNVPENRHNNGTQDRASIYVHHGMGAVVKTE